jgi:outer membrane lipoprotein-sorting protein
MRKFFLMLLLAVNSAAADWDATVSGWLAHQTNVQTWASDFTQTRTLKALAQPLVSTGRVWFAAPRNFRWELGLDQTVAIRSNETMLVMYPRLQRAEIYQFGKTGRNEWKDALALLESGFPRSRAELEQQFSILATAPMNDLVRLELEPKAAGARKMMPRINILLSSNLTLAGTELVFMDGSRMRNDFHNMRTNADVSGKFEFTIPPGFKVVEPLQERAR